MDEEDIKLLTDRELFNIVEAGDPSNLASQELHDRGYSEEEIRKETEKKEEN